MGGMRPDAVVIIAPPGKVPPNVSEALKDFLIQEFNTQASIIALDKGFLGRPSMVLSVTVAKHMSSMPRGFGRRHSVQKLSVD